jgi:hypothetical protein
MNHEIATLPAHSETTENSPVHKTCASESLKEIGSRFEQHLSVFDHGVATIAASSITVRQPAGDLSQVSYDIQPRASAPHVRNGKIARLPKLERDCLR